MSVSAEDRITAVRVIDRSAEDYQKIIAANKPYKRALADRVLEHLKLLQGHYGGCAVDHYEHCLQTATRAHRDGRDEEYVVCALLHDIGDILASWNHAEVAAALLKPFVSEGNRWMIEQHGIFQGYYSFHHLGLDRNMRDKFRGHPHFEHTAEFCHLYDQEAGDPAYDTMPIEAFIPMVQRVFRRPRESLYLPKKAEQ